MTLFIFSGPSSLVLISFELPFPFIFYSLLRRSSAKVAVAKINFETYVADIFRPMNKESE